MIQLSALDPPLIIGIVIVSLLLLLFALHSYQTTNVASGLITHIVAFVGYGIVFSYLWQTIGVYEHNGVWLAALTAAALVLFLLPLDYFQEATTTDDEHVSSIPTASSAENDESP